MKIWTRIWLALLLLLNASIVMAIEEANYSLVEKSGDIELRDYEPSIVAETLIEDDFEGAGNRAFRPLFKYISGENEMQDDIAMTAPVSQQNRSKKIAMTAPVSQIPSGEGWAVSFMMPSEYTMETIPQPTNAAVYIREVPGFRAAVIRFSGRWTAKNYAEHLDELKSWISVQQLTISGEPIWARYDPPFKPWFMRRNEILIPVS
jgi:hypothetical protein